MMKGISQCLLTIKCSFITGRQHTTNGAVQTSVRFATPSTIDSESTNSIVSGIESTSIAFVHEKNVSHDKTKEITESVVSMA
jgi:hypothetical protein